MQQEEALENFLVAHDNCRNYESASALRRWKALAAVGHRSGGDSPDEVGERLGNLLYLERRCALQRSGWTSNIAVKSERF